MMFWVETFWEPRHIAGEGVSSGKLSGRKLCPLYRLKYTNAAFSIQSTDGARSDAASAQLL